METVLPSSPGDAAPGTLIAHEPSSAELSTLSKNGSASFCQICGQKTETYVFCHIYDAGATITLCRPTCAETFLHG